MIFLNNEILLADKQELDMFIEGLKGEIFNEYSRNGVLIFEKYIYECYDAEERLIEMMHERMGEDLFPVLCINTDECSDLNQIDFMIMSSQEDREFTHQEEVVFHRLCDICFGHIKGFYDRICTEA